VQLEGNINQPKLSLCDQRGSATPLKCSDDIERVLNPGYCWLFFKHLIMNRLLGTDAETNCTDNEPWLIRYLKYLILNDQNKSSPKIKRYVLHQDKKNKNI
jgi:hypothetical protein